MRYRCCFERCGKRTDRLIYVHGQDGFWPVCGTCGRRMIRALMNLFPGKSIHTKGRNTQ